MTRKRHSTKAVRSKAPSGAPKRAKGGAESACSRVLIVKRRGQNEKFDSRKAYASVYFACRSAHLGEREAELIAESVLRQLCAKIKSKDEVSSREIFRAIASLLKQLNRDAAFMYETHLDVS